MVSERSDGPGGKNVRCCGQGGEVNIRIGRDEVNVQNGRWYRLGVKLSAMEYLFVGLTIEAHTKECPYISA